MFLLIPLGIFIVSTATIMYLVGRKFVYLKKLTPEAISDPPATAATFWSGFFPEIISLFQRINWREYRVRFMSESEKLLRRMRLTFLKIDTLTHRLIGMLLRSTKHHEALLVQEQAAKEQEEESVTTAEIDVPQLDPKEEEQHIIMEIGRNPKDAKLYRRLGDIYLQTHALEDARQSFEKVLELEPENEYATMKLDWLRNHMPA